MRIAAIVTAVILGILAYEVVVVAIASESRLGANIIIFFNYLLPLLAAIVLRKSFRMAKRLIRH